jgi:hypothetical protein
VKISGGGAGGAGLKIIFDVIFKARVNEASNSSINCWLDPQNDHAKGVLFYS